MIGRKISTKKYCRGIEQVLEAWSSRKKKDKAVSLLENGSEKKYSSSSQSSETKTDVKLVLVRQELLLYLEFNKPNKQNVYEMNSFNKFSFSQIQNNSWHTDWYRECETSKRHFLRSGKINT